MGGGATLGIPGEGPEGVRLPCKVRARAADCNCCCAACVVSVVARRVHAVAAQLALDSLTVASPGAVLLVVFRAFECVCVAKAERACVWCGLHRCRVVVCGTGGRCLYFVGCPFVVGLSRCSVCRVASLVEHYDTCLWLLSAWCWLVVSSGEVLPESFSVGSGGSEAEVIAWLPCVLVRFLKTVCCCPGEGYSENYFALVYVVVMLPQNLRCAVGLAGAFWRVFSERCLGGSGRGSPRTCLRCFCSSACCSVLSDGLCCLVVGLCILVKVLPRIALCRFWWRFFLGVLCVVLGHRCVAPVVRSVSFGWAAFW
ncbi:hypothetical protein Taro_009264 [Colocasia esculenta]|uniref:Uncharacterized protein n=1 Tax=Colocasia esculenta TaxID=4460 RepID=A0A843U587_COLES|nr:hypothetical protein [Colocasia esculenta]